MTSIVEGIGPFDAAMLRCPSRGLASGLAFLTLTIGLLTVLAVPAGAQTGAHGYVGGGAGFLECASGCPTSNGGPHETVGLIGGGYAWPLRKGRLWISGDINSRISNGYLDASGGPALVFGLRAPAREQRVEPFVHGGFRIGEDGGGNIGTGAHFWSRGAVGLRAEYQYQFQNATFYETDFSQPSQPTMQSKVWLDQHLIRFGIVIR